MFAHVPLLSHIHTVQYIHKHTQASLPLFLSDSPESWLDSFSSGIELVLMIGNDITVQ